ncbi:MAG: sugar phosphate isomerase/epimerase family protein [Planctomycetota bacterium]
MRIAASTFAFHRAFHEQGLDLSGYMEACEEFGLDAVELNDGFIEKEGADLKQLKRLSVELGLDIAALAIELVFVRGSREEIRAEESKLRQWLEKAYVLGCPILRVNTGQPPDRIEKVANKGVTREELMSWAAEAFRGVMPTAERMGIVLAMENHFALTATSRDTIEFVERVGSDWMGVNIDTGNFIHPDWAEFGRDWRREPDYFRRAPMQEDIYEGIERLAPHMVYSHVKIYGLTPDGMDDIFLDYDRILAIYRRFGYRGYISIENFSQEDPMELVPRAVEMLRGKLAAGRKGP